MILMVTIDLRNDFKMVTKMVPLVPLRDQVGPKIGFLGYQSQVNKKNINFDQKTELLQVMRELQELR